MKPLQWILLQSILLAVMVLGLFMQVVHIGPSNLWIAVVVVAGLSVAITANQRSRAGRR